MWFLVVLGGDRRELFCQNAETVKQKQEDKINNREDVARREVNLGPTVFFIITVGFILQHYDCDISPL